MKTKTKQDADPETNQPGTDAGPEPLNSVLMAQGAERLEFIRGLIDEPEPETEVKDDPDSDTQTDETPPAEPAEPATDETEEGEPDEGEEEQETDETDEQQSDDEIPGIKPEVQQAINRRIGKEVAKRRAAEARIEALETKLEQLSQAPQQPSQQPETSAILESVNSEAELESLLDKAREARTYARDATDRLIDESDAVIAELRSAGVRLAEDADLSHVRAELRKIRRNAETVLDREQSARKTLELRRGYAQQVARDFGWVKDRTSEEYATFRSAREHPAVRSRPDADFVAAIIVEGLASYKARTTKKPVPKTPATRRPAPQPGRPAAVRVEPNGSEAARQALQVDPSDRAARQRVLARMLQE